MCNGNILSDCKNLYEINGLLNAFRLKKISIGKLESFHSTEVQEYDKISTIHILLTNHRTADQ